MPWLLPSPTGSGHGPLGPNTSPNCSPKHQLPRLSSYPSLCPSLEATGVCRASGKSGAGGVDGDAEETGFLTPEKRSPEGESSCCLQISIGASWVGWSWTPTGALQKVRGQKPPGRKHQSKKGKQEGGPQACRGPALHRFCSVFHDTVRLIGKWIKLTPARQKHRLLGGDAPPPAACPSSGTWTSLMALAMARRARSSLDVTSRCHPDSFSAFAGWVTRWSSCPICHFWLEASGPVFGEQRGGFGAWISGFFSTRVPGPCPSGHLSLDKLAPQIHPAAPHSPPKQSAKGPFWPPTAAAFMRPSPTSAPRSVPPLGSLHRGGPLRQHPEMSLNPYFRSFQGYWC